MISPYDWVMWPFRRTPDLLEEQRKQLERDRADTRPPPLGEREGESPDEGFFEGFGPPPGVRPIKSWSGSISSSGSNVRVRVKSQAEGETSPRETSFSGTPGQLIALAVRHLLRSLLPKRGNQR